MTQKINKHAKNARADLIFILEMILSYRNDYIYKMISKKINHLHLPKLTS